MSLCFIDTTISMPPPKSTLFLHLTYSLGRVIVIGIMNKTWSFINGVEQHPCTTFPFAYRMLYNTLKKGIESGKSFDLMIRKFIIRSPLGTEYDYTRATELATQQGLLSPDGTINSREFKRK